MFASLTARSLTVSRGPQLLVSDADLVLLPGRRVGLVGRNGVGKSTLLEALAGRLEPERGTVTTTPPTATVGLLAQERDRSATETVRAYVSRRTGVAAAETELAAAAEALAAGAPGADQRYGDALERWTALGAADLEARLSAAAADLGLPESLLDRATGDLSGGEAARVGLASVVLSRYDVLLLDEPTNDLDADGLTRLEDWVLRQSSAIALVSHDRHFLARTITDVAEIDEFRHRVEVFAGGWEAHLTERETAQRQAQERFEAYDEKRRSLLARAHREREWAAQGRAKLRRDDEPDKNIRADRLDQTEQLAGRAARTERVIDRLDSVEEPRTPWELRFHIPTTGRSGDVVGSFHEVVVDRPGFRLGPITAAVGHGDRIALVGPNGSGKTTLIDLLAGRIEPDDGVLRRGSSVVLGEVEQTRRALSVDEELLTVVCTATGMTLVDARSLLAKFGLGPEHVHRATSSLSPGERTRASMAVLMANGANVLVLDEPTNHLDVEAIEQLESALSGFAGTVLLVSHDRALLENVEITRRWRMEDGRLAEETV